MFLYFKEFKIKDTGVLHLLIFIKFSSFSLIKEELLNKFNNNLFIGSLSSLLIKFKLLTLLIYISLISILLYCSFILFTFISFTIDKSDLKIFIYLFYLFFFFKDISSIKLLLF